MRCPQQKPRRISAPGTSWTAPVLRNKDDIMRQCWPVIWENTSPFLLRVDCWLSLCKRLKPFDILFKSNMFVFFGLIDCNCMMYIESQVRLTAIIDYVQYNVYVYNIYIIYVEVHCCCILNNIQTLWHDRGWDVDVGGNQVFHPTLQELPSIQLNPSPIEDLLKII